MSSYITYKKKLQDTKQETRQDNFVLKKKTPEIILYMILCSTVEKKEIVGFYLVSYQHNIQVNHQIVLFISSDNSARKKKIKTSLNTFIFHFSLNFTVHSRENK